MLGHDLLTKVNQIMADKEPGCRRDAQGRDVCFYCGAPLDTSHQDHVTPKKKGGVDQAFNLVTTCPTCNIRKNSKHPLYWLMQSETFRDAPDEVVLEYIARVLYHNLIVPG